MDAQSIALQAIGGFFVGALIGYAVRKAVKWLLILLGFALLPLFVLWQLGIIYVNWDAINEFIGRIIEWLGVNLSDLGSLTASLGVMGISGAVGFVFGLSGGLRHTILDVSVRSRRFVKHRSKNVCRASATRAGSGTGKGTDSTKHNSSTTTWFAREVKANYLREVGG